MKGNRCGLRGKSVISEQRAISLIHRHRSFGRAPEAPLRIEGQPIKTEQLTRRKDLAGTHRAIVEDGRAIDALRHGVCEKQDLPALADGNAVGLLCILHHGGELPGFRVEAENVLPLQLFHFVRAATI